MTRLIVVPEPRNRGTVPSPGSEDHRQRTKRGRPPISRRLATGVAVAVALTVTVASSARAAPSGALRATNPAVSIRAAGTSFFALSVSGRGFGAGGAYSRIEVGLRNPTRTVTFPFGNPGIVSWLDDQVVVKLSGSESPSSIRVVAQGLPSNAVPFESYTLDLFYTIPSYPPPAGYQAPGALRTDPSGRLWYSSEFYWNHSFWNPPSQSAIPVYYPQPAPVPEGERAPFWNSCVYGCSWSNMVTIGEGIVVDEYGRAWFTQGGGVPSAETTPGQDSPNHSRIVMFDPATQKGRLYHVPGNDNIATGIAWDSVRKRIWFANAGQSWAGVRVLPARLTSFDPEQAPYQEFSAYRTPAATTSFNYITSDVCNVAAGASVGTCGNNQLRGCLTDYDCVRVEDVCPPPAPAQPESTVADAGCFHEYALPGVWLALGVGAHPDGSIWFANLVSGKAQGLSEPLVGYGGQSLGQLDPRTGHVLYVPLPSSPDGSVPGPYDLHIAPNGDVLAGLIGASAIGRLDYGRFTNRPSNCTTLRPSLVGDNCAISDVPDSPNPSPGCQNPCVSERFDTSAWVPCTGPSCAGPYNASATVYGIGYEGAGATWYSRGYVRETNTGANLVYFPSLSLVYPSPYSFGVCSGILGSPLAGLGERVWVDPVTGDIWGKTACGYRLHRLRHVGS